MIYLSYEISNRFVDFVLMVDPIVLKRVINMILVIILMLGYNIRIEDIEKNKNI